MDDLNEIVRFNPYHVLLKKSKVSHNTELLRRPHLGWDKSNLMHVAKPV